MSERSADPRKRRGRRRGRRRGAAAQEGSAGVVPAGSDPRPESAPHVTPAPVTPVPPPAATQAAASPDRRRDRAVLETSAGGIVYRVQDGEPLFLLIRDSYRNWGFPKGHLESGEAPEQAAVREVGEETGLGALRVDGAIETIDWFFRFRGKLVHKVCHFYLMRTHHRRTNPQRDEGITACRWAPFEEATRLISYANARAVLVRAHEMVQAGGHGAPRVRGAAADEPSATAAAPGPATASAAEPAVTGSAAAADATPGGQPRRRRSRSRRRRGGGGSA